MNLEDRWLPQVIKDEWSGRMSCGRQTMCVLKIGISYYYGNKHKMLDGDVVRDHGALSILLHS